MTLRMLPSGLQWDCEAPSGQPLSSSTSNASRRGTSFVPQSFDFVVVDESDSGRRSRIELPRERWELHTPDRLATTRAKFASHNPSDRTHRRTSDIPNGGRSGSDHRVEAPKHLFPLPLWRELSKTACGGANRGRGTVNSGSTILTSSPSSTFPSADAKTPQRPQRTQVPVR